MGVRKAPIVDALFNRSALGNSDDGGGRRSNIPHPGKLRSTVADAESCFAPRQPAKRKKGGRMVQIQRTSASSTAANRSKKILSLILPKIIVIAVAVCCFWLVIIISGMPPIPPMASPPPILLSTPNTTKISTDVRGNLGPAEVMLHNGHDWIKDRWQAASDMHGTAIRGQHWVLLEFATKIHIQSIVLDWEAAYSNDYQLQGSINSRKNHPPQDSLWLTLFDTKTDHDDSSIANSVFTWSQETFGQSPGVKTKTPLHVVDTMVRKNSTIYSTGVIPPLQSLRLIIRSSAMGWGVSLWKVSVYGWPIPPSNIISTS
jgi:hypothetical protein